MARTKHKIVQKAAIAGYSYHRGKRKAKNSDLKQAAHKGRAPVKDTRNAPSGFAGVPASTATLPPGQGPPMSSTPGSEQRGSNSTARNARTDKAATQKGRKTTSRVRALQAIQPNAEVVSRGGAKAGGRGASSRRGRRRSKR